MEGPVAFFGFALSVVVLICFFVVVSRVGEIRDLLEAQNRLLIIIGMFREGLSPSPVGQEFPGGFMYKGEHGSVQLLGGLWPAVYPAGSTPDSKVKLTGFSGDIAVMMPVEPSANEDG